MKNKNFIILTEVNDVQKTSQKIIINTNFISTIYENIEENLVIVMNHPDFENNENLKKNYPKRIVVKEDLETLKLLLDIE